MLPSVIAELKRRNCSLLIMMWPRAAVGLVVSGFALSTPTHDHCLSLHCPSSIVNRFKLQARKDSGDDSLKSH